MERLLEQRGQVSPAPRLHFLQHPFEVPEGATRLILRLRYQKRLGCMLFLSVFGPQGYRGTRMNPGAVGYVDLELDLGETGAGPGAIGGPIEPGAWRAQIDIGSTDETVEYLLTADLLTTDAGRETGAGALIPRPAAENGRPGRGWYKGELHSHTTHSDGNASVAVVVAAARQYGLDFLSLTDHFTHAGWAELQSLAGQDLALLNGLELTGHGGHANLHGLADWVNTFVDDPDDPRGVNDVARAARDQGGLFCVNHAFSGTLGWRYHDLDWSLVDLYEAYHHLEGPNNAHQLTFWDGLLRAGHRITGVAGTDSHDPHRGRHRLGQVVTVIEAESLDPAALLAGLKAGRAYISLGPTLDFQATDGNHSAAMGETLRSPERVRLRARLGSLDRPARLFVMKNGLYHAHVDVPATGTEGLVVEVDDLEPAPGYYRLEVYARPSQPAWRTGREWDQTLLLSNPVFVEV